MVGKQSSGQADTAPDREDLMAVWESARNLPPDEVFNQIRYVLADLNGDGEGELLTGDAEGRITNLYTQQGGRPRHVKSGFVRDALYYLGGNRFLNTGSTGGRNVVLSLWHLDKQGSLVCDRYYYTREAEDDPARQEVYVGTDPNRDGTAAKRAPIPSGNSAPCGSNTKRSASLCPGGHWLISGTSRWKSPSSTWAVPKCSWNTRRPAT